MAIQSMKVDDILSQTNSSRASITDLKGIGKEAWKDLNVEAYIKEERASWD